LNSSGFHAANVILHCLASWLVGQTASILFGLPGAWAALAAAFFGVHPVHTENVLYLVGRADVLAAVFGTMAISLYSILFCPPPVSEERAVCMRPGDHSDRARNVMLLVAPALLVIASGLCKETGFTLYALFMLMELLDFIALHTDAVRRGLKIPIRMWRRRRLRVGVLLATTVVVFVARYRHTGGTSLNMSPQDNPISFETSRKVRILSYAYLHGVYAKLLVWPQFLCYDYSMDAIPSVHTLLDCRLLLPLAAYTGLFAAVAAAARAPPEPRRAALISLALLLVPYLPASNILFPVGTVIGERLLYIPSAGFCLAVAAALSRQFGWTRGLAVPATNGSAVSNGRRGNKTGGAEAARLRKAAEANAAHGRAGYTMQRRPAPTVILGACGVLTLLGVRTLLRVFDWQSSDVLFIRDGHLQPTSSKTQFNLGITYMQRQEYDSAVAALVRCAHADPLSSLPFYRIGQIEIMRGNNPSAERWLSAALDKFGASLMVRDEEVFHDLAVAMFQNGKAEAAERRLRIALQLNPDFAKGWNNLACCLAARNIRDASRASERAVALAPENPQYWANLALLAQHSGDAPTSQYAWNQAAQLWPSMPQPRDCTWEFAPGG